MSADAPVGPALLINTVGKGRVLTFACSPDFAVASEHHIVEARKLLAAAVRFLHPQPRVRVLAPANVEAVVTDDPAGRILRVHLLGYNSPPQTTPVRERPYVLPALLEDLPLFRASVELAGPPRSVAVLNPTTVLEQHAARLEVTVNEVHEVVLLGY